LIKQANQQVLASSKPASCHIRVTTSILPTSFDITPNFHGFYWLAVIQSKVRVTV